MSRSWIENTLKWLQKKAMEKACAKAKVKKKSLKLKFDKLLDKKQLLKELLLEESKDNHINHLESQNPARKLIYNNSKKKLTSHQKKLLELEILLLPQRSFHC